MVRVVVVLLLALAVAPRCGAQTQPRVLSVCELSNDFGAHRDKVIAVRGIYYYGLRQTCSQTCATGPWPSFLDLVGTGSREKSPAFVTDDANWAALINVQETVEAEAKKGKRLEIWVTAIGRLNTNARRTLLGPCDRATLVPTLHNWSSSISPISKSKRTRNRRTTIAICIAARYKYFRNS